MLVNSAMAVVNASHFGNWKKRTLSLAASTVTFGVDSLGAGAAGGGWDLRRVLILLNSHA